MYPELSLCFSSSILEGSLRLKSTMVSSWRQCTNTPLSIYCASFEVEIELSLGFMIRWRPHDIQHNDDVHRIFFCLSEPQLIATHNAIQQRVGLVHQVSCILAYIFADCQIIVLLQSPATSYHYANQVAPLTVHVFTMNLRSCVK